MGGGRLGSSGEQGRVVRGGSPVPTVLPADSSLLAGASPGAEGVPRDLERASSLPAPSAAPEASQGGAGGASCRGPEGGAGAGDVPGLVRPGPKAFAPLGRPASAGSRAWGAGRRRLGLRSRQVFPVRALAGDSPQPAAAPGEGAWAREGQAPLAPGPAAGVPPSASQTPASPRAPPEPSSASVQAGAGEGAGRDLRSGSAEPVPEGREEEGQGEEGEQRALTEAASRSSVGSPASAPSADAQGAEEGGVGEAGAGVSESGAGPGRSIVGIWDRVLHWGKDGSLDAEMPRGEVRGQSQQAGGQAGEGREGGGGCDVGEREPSSTASSSATSSPLPRLWGTGEGVSPGLTPRAQSPPVGHEAELQGIPSLEGGMGSGEPEEIPGLEGDIGYREPEGRREGEGVSGALRGGSLAPALSPARGLSPRGDARSGAMGGGAPIPTLEPGTASGGQQRVQQKEGSAEDGQAPAAAAVGQMGDSAGSQERPESWAPPPYPGPTAGTGAHSLPRAWEHQSMPGGRGEEDFFDALSFEGGSAEASLATSPASAAPALADASQSVHGPSSAAGGTDNAEHSSMRPSVHGCGPDLQQGQTLQGGGFSPSLVEEGKAQGPEREAQGPGQEALPEDAPPEAAVLDQVPSAAFGGLQQGQPASYLGRGLVGGPRGLRATRSARRVPRGLRRAVARAPGLQGSRAASKFPGLGAWKHAPGPVGPHAQASQWEQQQLYRRQQQQQRQHELIRFSRLDFKVCPWCATPNACCTSVPGREGACGACGTSWCCTAM